MCRTILSLSIPLAKLLSSFPINNNCCQHKSIVILNKHLIGQTSFCCGFKQKHYPQFNQKLFFFLTLSFTFHCGTKNGRGQQVPKPISISFLLDLNFITPLITYPMQIKLTRENASFVALFTIDSE